MTTEHLHVTVPAKVMRELERRRKTPNGELSMSAVVTGILEREIFVDRNQHRLDVQ